MRPIICLAAFALLLTPMSGTAQNKNPVVEMSVSFGNESGKIKIELYPKEAPVTVKNFLAYVDSKHYDNTIFHRVIKNFMIQGGGFNEKMQELKTNPAIKNESSNGLQNKRGTVAMARTNVPNSATAQFFINVKDNPFLDKANAQDNVGYCVFGKVIDGLDIVDKIRNVQTGKRFVQINGQNVPFDDVPADPVIIKSVRLVKQ